MKRAVLSAILVSLFFCNSVYPAGNIQATASSSETELLSPQNALDNNANTRWSSKPYDPQWFLVDLGGKKEISGLVLRWEAAYGKSYDILISEDGDAWKTVFSETGGDGKTDEIFFRKAPARYVKILCKERATTWGYSLVDVFIKEGKEGPAVTASSFSEGKDPSNAIDGDKKTEWKSGPQKGPGAQKAESLAIDFKKQKRFGGLLIFWGADFAKKYRILVSPDGSAWREIFSTEKGNGGKDLICSDETGVRFLKILCEESAAGGYSISEIILKGPDEAATPQKSFEIMAEDLPAGYFPKWIYKKQVYWTVAGIDGDEKKPIISEDGAVEPYFKSWSLAPFLSLNGKFITPEGAEVTQYLEKGYLPIPEVRWKIDGIVFDQKIFVSGEKGKSVLYIRYSLENAGKEAAAGKLYLTIRPFQVNPPWQYGGLSNVRSLKYQEGNPPSVVVNGSDNIYPFPKPERFGALTYKDGEIVEAVSERKIPPAADVDDKDGYASGVMEYGFSVPAGQHKDVFLFMPLYGGFVSTIATEEAAGELFEAELKKTISYWESKLNAVEIDVPDKDIVNALKSNLAYILINNEGPRLQPGPRAYKRAWMRDGATIAAALLRMGFKEEVRIFLDWIAAQIGPDGMVPFTLEEKGMPDWCRDWKEYDSQGEFVFAVFDYYNFTKDETFLREKWPTVERALRYITELRKKRLTDEYQKGEKKMFRGILPESNSHEGYFPPQHSYWDDFWAVKGLKDGKKIAKILGKEEAAKWIDAEENELRKSLLKSFGLVMKEKRINYIPGCAEKGDFDATSTAIGIFPCGEYGSMPQPQAAATFNKYYNETFLPRLRKGWAGSFTPYEIRTANAFLLMGEKEKALKMLEYFFTVMRPRAWNHLAEVVFSDYRHPQYIGDMPHTWIGAELVITIRDLFVYEKGGALILGAGIPLRWVEGKEGVTVKNLPTFFGNISYTLKREKEGLRLKIWGDAKPPKGFVFKSPSSGRDKVISKIPYDGIIALPE